MAEGDGIGTYCYYVTANEGPGNTYGFQETSTSNSDCATQTPRLFMPNAFTPNGDDKNEFFGPESVFIDQMPYEMFIYNRWGEEIFYTTDVFEGWDGTVEGKDAPMATYLFYVRYTNLDGETIEEQGTFQLIR
jgi:gliding motility-associated-like protein